MRMLKKFLSITASLYVMTLSGVLPAAAGEPIAVEADQTMMVTIPAVPGAVVIGNPIIADVSMQGTKMFILGRNFGTTNIHILDIDGNPMASFDVSVKHVTNNAMAVFKGDSRIAYTVRQSYDCAPMCESSLQIGDGEDYNKLIGGQIKSKIELATGEESAKSEAPPAPQ